MRGRQSSLLQPTEGPAGDKARRAQQLADSLDDRDLPLYTIGQAAQLLGVEPGVLRRLEATAAVAPARSSGRHRRYTRTQLERARRLIDLVGEGMSAGGAGRVIDLEDENANLRARLRTVEGRD
ncbi:MAG: MerR family transcriptional regulator [Mycobacteriales bacterium]